MKITKRCIQCDKLFSGQRNFCSKECKYSWGSPIKICPICGKKFRRYKCLKRIYCSQLCSNRSRPIRKERIKKICRFCKKEFLPTLRGKSGKNQTYCSKHCKDLFGRGKNHWNWKGGIARENHRRETKEYKDWRLEVYRRDHFTCRDCGKHCGEGNIVAHHLEGWDKFPKSRYVVENGITLCRKCHRIRHGKT